MPDGTPYATERYKQIIEERYQITKYCNTSYEDSGNMTPSERRYLLQFIKNDLEKNDKMMQEAFNR